MQCGKPKARGRIHAVLTLHQAKTGDIGLFLESAIRRRYQSGMRREVLPWSAVALTAGAQIALALAAHAGPHDELIAKHAAANGVPEHLVRRVIRIESRGNAASAHAGNYGLMQIRLATARGVGYSGEARGLLDPDTNLTYAVKYLAGAYRAAGCNADRAVAYYQRGYYGSAKHECAAPASAVMQLAEAQTKRGAKSNVAAAKTALDTAAAKPADVIKPKVVRTETIATAKSRIAPARPVGAFEPARVAPPPVAASNATPVKQQADRPEPAAEPVARIELASVPMPPVRPEIEPASKPAHHAERAHKRSDKKSKSVAQPKVEPKSAESKLNPTGVVSFLKKLVTPDSKPRTRSVEAQSDPQSQTQPPQ